LYQARIVRPESIVVLNDKVVVREKCEKVPDLIVRQVGKYVFLIFKYSVLPIEEENTPIPTWVVPDRLNE